MKQLASAFLMLIFLNPLVFSQKKKPISLVPDANGKLDLRGLKLKTIPPEVFQLTELKHLDLSKNKLSEIPEDLGNLKNLEELNISSNKIKKLPDGLCKLSNLKSLLIFKNDLDKLPSCFNELKNLEKLDAWNNYLFSVAPQLLGLTKLKSVELRVNPISAEEK